jgi:hypothetical protein
MAKDKKSFIAYADWLELFEELEDDEAGRLAKHLFRYVNDLNPDAPDKLTKISFVQIKQALKRDLKKYEIISERNKTNGSKGGRPKKAKKPTGLSGLNEKPKKADNDSDNDSDNDIKETPLTPKGESFDFDAYLKFINKTLGKNRVKVCAKTKREIPKRLKEGYTKKQIEWAIINVKDVQIHKDNNYHNCTPEFFSREKTLQQYGEPPKKDPRMIGATTEYYQHD